MYTPAEMRARRSRRVERFGRVDHPAPDYRNSELGSLYSAIVYRTFVPVKWAPAYGRRVVGGQVALGERIRQRRREKGLRAIDLANDARISKTYLSDLEAGKATRPSAPVLARLADALGTTVADLLEEEAPTQDAVIPAALRALAEEEGLAEADVRMLAAVRWRGEQPLDLAGWRFLFEAIRRAVLRPGEP